ncbi:hypothetical protein KVV02_000451 [Mortierella alpina]|uniref:PPM-type phosphatase domain-containing protein n=1 Tax=Mortierella alpina TaxID=64518 RepID=A0A9P8D2W5_MORAP|nr:hypothetical protein KVV02_000451 [Mortierella alpina]
MLRRILLPRPAQSCGGTSLFSTSATPFSRCWRTGASTSRPRTHKPDSPSIKKIRKSARKAVFTDAATVSGTTAPTAEATSATVAAAAAAATGAETRVGTRVIPLKKGHSQHTERLDHARQHDRSQRRDQHHHEDHRHTRHQEHGDRTSRLHYEDFLPPRHHRRHFLHRLRLMHALRQQQMHHQQQQQHAYSQGPRQGRTHAQQQYHGGYSPWGTHWGNPYWNPWMLHLIESKRAAGRSFVLGAVITGVAIGIYNRKNQWKQWPAFMEDLSEVRSMLSNVAGSSLAPFRSFSTSTASAASVGVTAEYTQSSQGIHGSHKKLSMLTPEQVEIRLAQHQRSFKIMEPRDTRKEKRLRQGPVLGYSVNQLPSNYPIEDDFSQHAVRNDQGEIEQMFFGVFDGHSGWCCSQKVARELAPSVARELELIKDPKDTGAVAEAIERGFLKLDHRIVHDSVQRVLEHPSRHLACSSLLPAISGACALMAYVDLREKDLYVACAGDSRAVMGTLEQKADGGRVWRAVPLSFDQTGRNRWEVKRLQEEHPGEETTVVTRGRVLGGLEPTRAFGDARYKWTRHIQDKVFELFPAYRQPRSNYKTPPYVTAKPVVRHHKLQPQDRFLVMATDGLWDKLTSDEVVQLVGNLLDGKVGQEEMFLDRDQVQNYRRQFRASQTPTHPAKAAENNTSTTQKLEQQQQQQEEEELTPPNRQPKGPVSQIRKFTYRDHAHASTHLIRNALGGADDDKVAATLTIPSPISRAYRDDITVTVVFFGQQDTTMALSDAKQADGLVDIR